MSKQLPLFICTACKRYIQYEYEDVRHLPFEFRFEVLCPVCSQVNRIPGTHFQSLFGEHRKDDSLPPEPEPKDAPSAGAVQARAEEVYLFWQKNREDLKKTAEHFKITQKAVKELLQQLPTAEVGPGRSRAK